MQLASACAAPVVCADFLSTMMGLATFPRNRDTVNEELSTVTEYLTKLNDMCAVETELDPLRRGASRGGRASGREGASRLKGEGGGGGVSHDTQRAQTCTFKGPGIQKHQTPREGRKERILRRGREKRARF